MLLHVWNLHNQAAKYIQEYFAVNHTSTFTSVSTFKSNTIMSLKWILLLYCHRKLMPSLSFVQFNQTLTLDSWLLKIFFLQHNCFKLEVNSPLPLHHFYAPFPFVSCTKVKFMCIWLDIFIVYRFTCLVKSVTLLCFIDNPRIEDSFHDYCFYLGLFSVYFWK